MEKEEVKTEREELLGRLEDIHNLSMLPVHFFSDGMHVRSFCKDKMPNDYRIYSKMIKERPDVKGRECILWNDRTFPQIYYGVMESGNRWFLIGPCSLQKLPFSYIHEYCREYQLRQIDIPPLSLKRAEAALSLISAAANGSSCKPARAIKEEASGQAVTTMTSLSYHLRLQEENFSHHPYEQEKQMKDMLMEGDAEKMLRFLGGLNAESIGRMGTTDVKNAEYGAVLGVSLLTRYAIEAGMDQYEAYEMNDLYLQRISQIKEIEEYSRINMEAVVYYANRIGELRQEETSNLYIRKCKEYVYGHLNKPVTVQQIADELGITNVYLSQMFSKAQGETLKSYLLRKRIEASENMLKYSEYSIREIAEYFCFNSQSHYGRVFKSYTGYSPRQYRIMQSYPEGFQK